LILSLYLIVHERYKLVGIFLTVCSFTSELSSQKTQNSLCSTSVGWDDCWIVGRGRFS